MSRPIYLQDYGKHGVIDMEDKQKLFRLLKRLSQPDSHGPYLVKHLQPVANDHPVIGGADLLDLDQLDENLLPVVSAPKRCLCMFPHGQPSSHEPRQEPRWTKLEVPGSKCLLS
jgi:hypothetical protein